MDPGELMQTSMKISLWLNMFNLERDWVGMLLVTLRAMYVEVSDDAHFRGDDWNMGHVHSAADIRDFGY